MLLKYLIIVALLVALELVYFRVADRFDIIDKPNLRSSHKRIVLRGGGIIFLLGAWIYQAFFGFDYGAMMAGLTAVGIMSFADDIHSVPNSLRLVTQFVAVVLMFATLGLAAAVPWWAYALAVVVAVGIINAYNFMDGINGITGGYSLAVLLPLMYLNQELDFVDQRFLVVMSLSVCVFCVFNFREHARCFAGDVGSISIAFFIVFALAALILATGRLTYLLFLGVYGVDSVLTILHRIRLGESLGVAHRKHAYQLMSNELRMPHTFVSAIYMVLQLAVSYGLIWWEDHAWAYTIIVLTLLVLAYLLFMKKYYPLHEAYLKSIQQQ